MKSIRIEGARFILGGAVNTAVSYVAYLAALLVMPYVAAFCVAFMTGILVAFLVNSRFVFRTDIVWRKIWGVGAIYAVHAGLGLAMLIFWVQWAHVDERIAPLLNVAILTPATFLANRWWLVKRGIES